MVGTTPNTWEDNSEYVRGQLQIREGTTPNTWGDNSKYVGGQLQIRGGQLQIRGGTTPTVATWLDTQLAGEAREAGAAG